MEFKFIAVNGDNVGDSIGSAIATDNHEELSRITDGLKNAHGSIEEWVQAVGGEIVTSSGDEGIYKIPVESYNEAAIEDIKNKYSEMSGNTITIGVGDSMSEASKALIYGKMNDKDQVVEYDPHIDDYIANEDVDEAPQDEDIHSEIPEDGMEEDPSMQEDPEAQLQEEIPEDGMEDPEAQLQEEIPEDGMEDPEAQLQEFGEDIDGDGDGDSLPMEEDSSIESPVDEDAGISEDYPEDFGKIPVEGQDELPEQAPDEGEMPQEGMEDPAMQDPSMQEEVPQDAAQMQQNPQESDIDPSMQEVPEEGMEEAPQEMSAEDIAGPEMEEGMQEGMEDPAMQEGMEEEFPEDMEEESQDPDRQGALSDMIHSNMEGEEGDFPQEVEDEMEGDFEGDDELREDIVNSLMTFKENKMMLEQAKVENPKLYEATILMLRSMIEMAKKLNMNPEADLNDEEVQGDLPDAGLDDPEMEEVPMEEEDSEEDSEEEVEEEAEEEENPFGKSEITGLYSDLMKGINILQKAKNRKK